MKARLFILCIVLLLAAPIASADYREEFEKGFLTKTWAGPQVEENSCIECHMSGKMKQSFLDLADEWKASWHAQNNIACHDCHGGDPRDPSLSMSPHRGFVGVPGEKEIPEFCGKCHIGILKNYLESGHGKALTAGTGPNCITCHGSHGVQKANIDIINEQRCSKCHSYDRARMMKQALFVTDEKITMLEKEFEDLRHEGVYIDEEAKNLFAIQAEFRTLFHTVDVDLVKSQTDVFSGKLAAVEKTIQGIVSELRYRRNFSAFLFLVFGGMAAVVFLISKTPRE